MVIRSVLAEMFGVFLNVSVTTFHNYFVILLSIINLLYDDP